MSARGRRSGVTLLEVMIALVILGTVIVGMLEVFAASTRVARNAEEWSRGVAYAEEAMESLKLDSIGLRTRATETLPGGYARRVSMRPWRDPALSLLIVTVRMPGGAEHELTRLVTAR